MFLKAKFRKIFLTAIVGTIVGLAFLPHLGHVRHHDLQKMWKQFASITKRLKQQGSIKNETEEAIAKDLKLTSEGRALLAGNIDKEMTC